MDPISTGIATGAAAGAAEELGKAVIRHLQDKPQSNEICVEEKIPGTKGSVKVCVEPEQVCGIIPHPETGLPVKACVTTKVTRADAHEVARQIASELADSLAKQIDTNPGDL